MALKERSNSSYCPGIESYLKSVVQGTPVEDFISLMSGAEFRDIVVEGCNGE